MGVFLSRIGSAIAGGFRAGGWARGLFGSALRGISHIAFGIGTALLFLVMAPDVAKTIVVPVLTTFLKIAGDILNWVLSPDFNRLPLTHGGVVDIGWTLSREIVNMFFVLWMVIMAFGTILGSDEYGWRRIFFKLIMVALLVNFTQVIAGVIVDMGQILMNFFVGSGLRERGVEFLVQNLNIAKLFTTAQSFFATSQAASQFNWFQGKIADYAIVTLQISFLGLATAMFLQIALLFIMRVVMIWVLVMLAPIAFVFGIMPFSFSRGLIGKWFSQIFAWSFVGVIMMFFMYLAALLAQTLNQGYSLAIARTSPDIANAFNPPADPYIVSVLGQSAFIGTMGPILIFFAVYLFLHIGYSTAQSTGAMGAEIASSLGTQLLNYGANFLKGAFMRGFRWGFGKTKEGFSGAVKGWRDDFLATGIGQKTLEKIEKSKMMQLGPVREGVIKLKSAMQAASEEAKKFKESIKNISSQGLAAMYPGLSASQKAAVEQLLIDRGEFSKLNLTKEQIKQSFERAKNINEDYAVKIGMHRPDIIFENDETAMIKFYSQHNNYAHLTATEAWTIKGKPNTALAAAAQITGTKNIIKNAPPETVAAHLKAVEALDKSTTNRKFSLGAQMGLPNDIAQTYIEKQIKGQKDALNNVAGWAVKEPKA